MAENNLEEIKICIQILPDMSEEAQRKAIEENPQNAKTGLNFIEKFGDTVESSRIKLSPIKSGNQVGHCACAFWMATP
jgi:serralysin